MARLKIYIHNWLIALDQFAFVTLAGPKYLLFGGHPPSPQETISSKVGRSSNKGKRWAKIAEWFIDHLFMLVGSKPGHCQRSIVAEEDYTYGK